jgi:hypothetical protein
LAKKKERKPQYGPSMVVGVVPTFKIVVVYLGKRTGRKEEYGCGITCIWKCEVKLLGTKAHAN